MRKYIIPTLKDSAQPCRTCPGCNTPTGLIHQSRRLSLTDTRIGSVTKVRLRCRSCHKTWTCQPDGLKPHFHRPQRVHALNILFYALGLSFEAVSTVWHGCGLSRRYGSLRKRQLLESFELTNTFPATNLVGELTHL